jgi:hypothetical protein
MKTESTGKRCIPGVFPDQTGGNAMTDRQLMMKMDQVSLSKRLSTVDKAKEMAVLLVQAYFSGADLLIGTERKPDGTNKPVGMVFEFREENQGRVTLPVCFSSQLLRKVCVNIMAAS